MDSPFLRVATVHDWVRSQETLFTPPSWPFNLDASPIYCSKQDPDNSYITEICSAINKIVTRLRGTFLAPDESMIHRPGTILFVKLANVFLGNNLVNA